MKDEAIWVVMFPSHTADMIKNEDSAQVDFIRRTFPLSRKQCKTHEYNNGNNKFELFDAFGLQKRIRSLFPFLLTF
jgi:hypothetical protein